MKNILASFSGFSVNDLEAARVFYIDTLGFELIDDSMGLRIGITNGTELFIYEKADHQPATFTVMNFMVKNIDDTVDDLLGKGISFERYELGNGAEQDDKDILRGLAADMGPDIAWFRDPAGNTLAVLQSE